MQGLLQNHHALPRHRPFVSGTVYTPHIRTTDHRKPFPLPRPSIFSNQPPSHRPESQPSTQSPVPKLLPPPQTQQRHPPPLNPSIRIHKPSRSKDGRQKRRSRSRRTIPYRAHVSNTRPIRRRRWGGWLRAWEAVGGSWPRCL